jgi:hypothetical protein
MAIYYPSVRRDLWNSLLPDLNRACELAGVAHLNIQELPFDTAAALHENLVWSICSSDRVLIDTTGPIGPDLYGVFGLGYATALSRRPRAKRIFKIAERDYSHSSKLSLWEAELSFEWGSRAELLAILDRLLRSGSKHAQYKQG